MQRTGEDLGNADDVRAEFDRLNLDLAHQKGMNTLAYCCVGCAYMARSTKMRLLSARLTSSTSFLMNWKRSLSKSLQRSLDTLKGAILFTKLVSHGLAWDGKDIVSSWTE